MSSSLSAELEPAQYYELLSGQVLPENNRLGCTLVFPGPNTEANVKAESEKFLTLRAATPALGGIVSLQIKGESKAPTFSPPERVRYTKNSYHGGDITFLPAEYPVIGKTSCTLTRECQSLEGEWHLDWKVICTAAIQFKHSLVKCCMLSLSFIYLAFTVKSPTRLCCTSSSVTMLHTSQLQSNRVFRVLRGGSRPPSARLTSLRHAAPKRPSGKSFILQVTGTFKFTARRCCGELCSTASTGFGPLTPFDGKALRLARTAIMNNGLGQELEMTTAQKLDVDVDRANALLASGELLIDFRYKHPGTMQSSPATHADSSKTSTAHGAPSSVGLHKAVPGFYQIVNCHGSFVYFNGCCSFAKCPQHRILI